MEAITGFQSPHLPLATSVLLGKFAEGFPSLKAKDYALEIPGSEGLGGGGRGRGHCEASVPTENVEESYEENVQHCWVYYNSHMDSVKDWCNWTLISR